MPHEVVYCAQFAAAAGSPPLSRVDQFVTLPVLVCEYALELITREYCHLLTLIDSVIILWSKLTQRQIPPRGN